MNWRLRRGSVFLMRLTTASTVSAHCGDPERGAVVTGGDVSEADRGLDPHPALLRRLRQTGGDVKRGTGDGGIMDWSLHISYTCEYIDQSKDVLGHGLWTGRLLAPVHGNVKHTG
ncbi:hypothetical protein ACOMHN_042397 [Nucella lapillus]